MTSRPIVNGFRFYCHFFSFCSEVKLLYIYFPFNFNSLIWKDQQISSFLKDGKMRWFYWLGSIWKCTNLVILIAFWCWSTSFIRILDRIWLIVIIMFLWLSMHEMILFLKWYRYSVQINEFEKMLFWIIYLMCMLLILEFQWEWKKELCFLYLFFFLCFKP